MNTKKLLLSAFVVLLFSGVSLAQVGIGTNTPAASAQLDVASTERGFLPPRMTSAQRDLIATPATGLLIFQTDNTPGYYFYNGTAWVALGGNSSSNGLGGYGEIRAGQKTNVGNVIFSTPMPNLNYSISITPDNWHGASNSSDIYYTNKTLNGFTINLRVGALNGTVVFDWMAISNQ